MTDRQGLQQDGVNQCEDRGVRSNTERDREDDGSREAGRLLELAEGKFQIIHG
jgi:hypothetical protein